MEKPSIAPPNTPLPLRAARSEIADAKGATFIIMFDEKHYTPAELAKLWCFSEDTIRRWFENEPGVLLQNRPERLHKRGYKSMRIPTSVVARVYAKHLSK